MAEEVDARLRLAEYLTALVAELTKVRSTEKDNLTYDLNGVTLEVDIVYTLTQPASGRTKGKPEFWVLRSGPGSDQGGLPSAQWNTQRVILRLTPRPDDVPAGDLGNVNTARLPHERWPDVES